MSLFPKSDLFPQYTTVHIIVRPSITSHCDPQPIMGLMEDLRKQARETETETEAALNQLNELMLNLESGGLEVTDGQSLPEEKTYALITRGLEKIKQLSVDMSGIAVSRVDQANVNRLTEIHQALTKEFAKAKAALNTKREKNKLMGAGRSQQDEEYTGLLLRENRSLDSSLSMTKAIISQASEVKDSLHNQKLKLQGAADKVVKFAETLPGINILLSRISRRHKLNALVIGLALAVCFIITFIYVF